MNKKRDITDDWWNPEPFAVYSRKAPEDKTVFAIQRAKRVPVTGNRSHIVEWNDWETFDSAEERDAALVKLQDEHPMWRLRPHQYNPYLDSIRQF